MFCGMFNHFNFKFFQKRMEKNVQNVMELNPSLFVTKLNPLFVNEVMCRRGGLYVCVCVHAHTHVYACSSTQQVLYFTVMYKSTAVIYGFHLLQSSIQANWMCLSLHILKSFSLFYNGSSQNLTHIRTHTNYLNFFFCSC